MPWATAASNNAMPSVAMAGTATTSSPGRRTRRSASRRRTSGCDSSDRPSRWSRSNARNAAGRPGSPASRRASSSGSARPAASTTTSSPSRIADRAATRTASPASSGSIVRQVVAGGIANHDRPASGRVRRPDRHEGAFTAPPRLEQVLVGVERRRQWAREHRPQVRQIGQPVGLEAQRELVGHRGPMVAR